MSGDVSFQHITPTPQRHYLGGKFLRFLNHYFCWLGAGYSGEYTRLVCLDENSHRRLT